MEAESVAVDWAVVSVPAEAGRSVYYCLLFLLLGMVCTVS